MEPQDFTSEFSNWVRPTLRTIFDIVPFLERLMLQLPVFLLVSMPLFSEPTTTEIITMTSVTEATSTTTTSAFFGERKQSILFISSMGRSNMCRE